MKNQTVIALFLSMVFVSLFGLVLVIILFCDFAFISINTKADDAYVDDIYFFGVLEVSDENIEFSIISPISTLSPPGQTPTPAPTSPTPTPSETLPPPSQTRPPTPTPTPDPTPSPTSTPVIPDYLEIQNILLLINDNLESILQESIQINEDLRLISIWVLGLFALIIGLFISLIIAVMWS